MAIETVIEFTDEEIDIILKCLGMMSFILASTQISNMPTGYEVGVIISRLQNERNNQK